MHSPLRYPGGKSDFFIVAKEIISQADLRGKHIVEPYAGSAAVSLGLLDHGLAERITLIERDVMLYAFWFCVFNRTDDLIVRFQDLEISMETWEQSQALLKVELPTKSNILDLAVGCLFLNRANYSGILNAGPIGGKGQKSAYDISCRTNKDAIISRILALSMLAPSVRVKFGDAVEWIIENKKKTDLFVYLDPPYFNKGELLYRHFYKLSQHKRLAAALADAKFPWLLSYDDHHVIEFLYEDFFLHRQSFRYSARSPKFHDELLISNFQLPRLENYSQPARRPRHLNTFSATAEPAITI